MLTELRIDGMGVIESTEVVLGTGLTALTGETGAGKTMLVEAISLLVGGRADPAIVRPGHAEARVEGRFVLGDEEYVVARVVPENGRSRGYINGRLATAGQLAELASRAVDLHGQHAHQSLLSTSHQREALDRAAGTDREPLRDARARLTEIDAALAALGGDARTRLREVDLLRFQLAELDAAALDDADEDAVLERLQDTLSGAVEHRQAGLRAAALLSDDDAAADLVAAALHAFDGRGPYGEIEGRLRTVAAELADVAGEARRIAEGIDEDPQRLAEIGERRQLLRDLRRKYADSLAEVIAFRDETAQRLAELESYDRRVAELELLRVAAAQAERAAAAAVGAQRRAGAGRLGTAVQRHLRALAMPHATLVVTVGEDDPGDDVTFLLAANPGTPPLPLARVASGGELARTMLALRLVLSEAPDTLVFDEVDAGIGGAAAVAVGAALAELGARHQVLVVTHLAQVAALADEQIVVSKRVVRGATVTTARRLSDDERIEEVARMLSGQEASESARRHAAELLGSRPHNRA
ncbi:MAG: recN [Ilumatobacteraceae bacterium]|nr:recN [Ilumatobacteraceae bacterium]